MDILKIREKLVNVSCDLSKTLVKSQQDHYLANRQVSAIYSNVSKLWSEVVHQVLPLKLADLKSSDYTVDMANDYVCNYNRSFQSNANIHMIRMMKLGYACVNLIDAVHIEAHLLHVEVVNPYCNPGWHSFKGVVQGIKGKNIGETKVLTIAKNLALFQAFNDLGYIDILQMLPIIVEES